MTSSEPATRTPLWWAAPAALAIALIAVGLAIWALMRPSSESDVSTQAAPVLSVQQPGDAKTRVCTAFDIVRNAVSIQTNADLGPDPVAREAVAANARLATLGGGSYLLSRVDSTVPAELAEAIRSFANNLQDIGMKQLVGVPNTDPSLTAQLNDAQTASARISELCK